MKKLIIFLTEDSMLVFYDQLPKKFNRQGFLKVAQEPGTPIETEDKYIGQFKPQLIQHEDNDSTTM